MLVLFAVAAALASWLVVFRLRRRRMYELAARLAGGRPAHKCPFVGDLLLFTGNTEDIMNSLKYVSEDAIKCDGIASVWIGHILYFVMVDPVDIEYVLKTCLEKDDLHRFIRTIIGNGSVFAPVPIWRRRRKVMVPAFSSKNLESFVEVFSEQSEVLAEQLGKHVGKGPVDAWPFFSSYTLDSVSETVMGVKMNAQSNKDGTFLTAMTDGLNLACERIFKIWQQPDWLYRLNPAYKHHQRHIGVMHSLTDNIIKAKRVELESEKDKKNGTTEENEDAGTRKSFLDHLISQSSKHQGYSNLELREEVLALTIAGTDTSAVGSCFTLALLGQHQDVQERVYQELVDVYGYSKKPLVKEDLPKLVLLERVIKESLRLYPPVPFIIRKIEKEITLPSGKILPADSGAAISIWGVHRDPKHWGADADEFNPDRFIPERYADKHPCTYIPFSGSPRNCVGYQFAMMSMKTSISAVLRKYRVRVVGDLATNKQIPVKIDVMMKAVHGYNIVLEPRDMNYNQ